MLIYSISILLMNCIVSDSLTWDRVRILLIILSAILVSRNLDCNWVRNLLIYLSTVLINRIISCVNRLVRCLLYSVGINNCTLKHWILLLLVWSKLRIIGLLRVTLDNVCIFKIIDLLIIHQVLSIWILASRSSVLVAWYFDMNINMRLMMCWYMVATSLTFLF